MSGLAGIRRDLELDRNPYHLTTKKELKKYDKLVQNGASQSELQQQVEKVKKAAKGRGEAPALLIGGPSPTCIIS